jgi:hypothetical protein
MLSILILLFLLYIFFLIVEVWSIYSIYDLGINDIFLTFISLALIFFTVSLGIIIFMDIRVLIGA